MNRTLAAPAATASARRSPPAALYLASDDSAWMIAHPLAIDGGLSA